MAALLSWGRWGRPGRTRGRAWMTTLGPLGVGRREADAILDATLIGAADDTEVAVLAPVWVPAVRDLPIRMRVRVTARAC